MSPLADYRYRPWKRDYDPERWWIDWEQREIERTHRNRDIVAAGVLYLRALMMAADEKLQKEPK